MSHALPNLIVIGGQKCGTTSLHAYLDAHPEISMARPKELNFFAGEGWGWERGLEWYSTHFDERFEVRGESSPMYSHCQFVPGVPRRIHQVVPQAKLIYMVRDPVERMISQYVHYRAAGEVDRSFREVISERPLESGYVQKSRYYSQIEPYLECFPASRLLVVALEQLSADRVGTMQRVLRFLGVEDTFVSPNWGSQLNTSADQWSRGLERRGPAGRRLARLVRRGGRPGQLLRRLASRSLPRPEVDDELIEMLRNAVRADVLQLRRHTGQAFDYWAV